MEKVLSLNIEIDNFYQHFEKKQGIVSYHDSRKTSRIHDSETDSAQTYSKNYLKKNGHWGTESELDGVLIEIGPWKNAEILKKSNKDGSPKNKVMSPHSNFRKV